MCQGRISVDPREQVLQPSNLHCFGFELQSGSGLNCQALHAEQMTSRRVFGLCRFTPTFYTHLTMVLLVAYPAEMGAIIGVRLGGMFIGATWVQDTNRYTARCMGASICLQLYTYHLYVLRIHPENEAD